MGVHRKLSLMNSPAVPGISWSSYLNVFLRWEVNGHTYDANLYPSQTPETMSKSVLLSGERTILLWRIIIAVTVYSWRPNACNNMFHLPFVFGMKCCKEVYKQLCGLKIFWIYSFEDSTDSQNLWSCGSISLKTVLVFSKNFFRFQYNCEADHYNIFFCPIRKTHMIKKLWRRNTGYIKPEGGKYYLSMVDVK